MLRAQNVSGYGWRCKRKAGVHIVQMGAKNWILYRYFIIYHKIAVKTNSPQLKPVRPIICHSIADHLYLKSYLKYCIINMEKWSQATKLRIPGSQATVHQKLHGPSDSGNSTFKHCNYIRRAIKRGEVSLVTICITTSWNVTNAKTKVSHKFRSALFLFKPLTFRTATYSSCISLGNDKMGQWFFPS